MKILPGVLNLSPVETPMALIDCLSDGAKNVPHDQLSEYDYFVIVNQDIRNMVARCFSKVVGFWPMYNHNSSFCQLFTEIISQCPCNHIFIISCIP